MNMIPLSNEDVFQINGDWAPQAKLLQAQFPLLTDVDLHFDTGKEHEMLIRVETRLSIKRNEVIDLIRKREQKDNNTRGKQM
jgi:hypothetical protein